MRKTKDNNRRSLQRMVRPHVTLHEADLLCLSSEIMLCKIKVGRVQRDMMVALESIDALVTRLDDAHRRVNEHREACKRAERPNDPSSATRPTGRVDCNRSAMAGFAAAHG